jgi:hypothetical protein
MFQDVVLREATATHLSPHNQAAASRKNKGAAGEAAPDRTRRYFQVHWMPTRPAATLPES